MGRSRRTSLVCSGVSVPRCQYIAGPPLVSSGAAWHDATASEEGRRPPPAGPRLPVEQPALPFKGADAGDVLHRLDDAAIGAGRVAHREVADVQELAAELDPELGGALVAGTERVDDLLHLVHARRRVAVLHLAPDHAGAAGEDALALAVVAHLVVLVDELEVDGEGGEHEVQLLEREAAGGELQEAGGRSRPGRSACGAGSDARRLVRRRPRRHPRDEGVADLAFVT